MLSLSMDTSDRSQDLDPRKLAHAGWGTAVPIAEILRQQTINSICNTIHMHWMHEVLRRCGSTFEEAQTNLKEGYTQRGWSDAAHMLALHMTKNLLRQLPLDEFIEHSPQDFLRRNGLDDDGEVPEVMVKLCGRTNYDFWYGMLTEGSEISATADGILRVRARVMEVAGITEDQCAAQSGMAIEIGSVTDERTREVAEHAIRIILGKRFACATLLDRDRKIDAVHHILMDATQNLCAIMRQERRQRRSGAADDEDAFL